jgi:hypothetical protein
MCLHSDVIYLKYLYHHNKLRNCDATVQWAFVIGFPEGPHVESCGGVGCGPSAVPLLDHGPLRGVRRKIGGFPTYSSDELSGVAILGI